MSNKAKTFQKNAPFRGRSPITQINTKSFSHDAAFFPEYLAFFKARQPNE